MDKLDRAQVQEVADGRELSPAGQVLLAKTMLILLQIIADRENDIRVLHKTLREKYDETIL
jgi:hypothetical protein